ncbi:hypothetical protein [Pseudoxanthomonas winnipegensis]|uniref:Uncharacterized protein n=1 Tax=Pseudoxanthomonas winnipegensis TaxID=2480810 RepID=A0A4Q8M3U0_9GAMM|nr:hypothetical protein [Pseudoxanthomonas winnipegensis]TAA42541.1 hypothetical protein EA655_11040 [Pseudoxanthomonas winnipegensis]
MLGEFLQFEDLQQLCRPAPSAPRPKLRTVINGARAQKIRFLYDGSGGIFTTRSAVEAAMAGHVQDDQGEAIKDLI